MTLIHPEQMHSMLAGAAIIGAKTAAMMMGSCSSMMIRKEAYEKYGNKTVKKWHKEGLLHPEKRRNGSYDSVYFPVIELMLASQSELVNRLTPMANDEISTFMLEEIKSN